MAEKEEGADLSPLALYSYFVKRSTENMHIIIAMSPIGNTFRSRLRQFPSLINCCTIDWFQVFKNIFNDYFYIFTYCMNLILQSIDYEFLINFGYISFFTWNVFNEYRNFGNKENS